MGVRKIVHSRVGAVVAGATVLVTLGGVGGAVAAGLVTSADIKNETIRQQDIRRAGVATSEIMNQTIRRRDIRAGGVASSEIADGSIRQSDIGTGGVGSSEVADGSLAMGDLSAATQTSINHAALVAVPSGQTIRGVAGGDFHATTASGESDFGVDVTLPLRAPVALGDADVEVDVTGWTSGDAGQTVPTSGDGGNATCTGTPANPTAPAGKVCIYVAGSDNAANVVGYSVLPGTGKSPYGFKLKWDIPDGAGDTFVDAVWAYTAP